jgi:hypothetical protein
VTFDKALIAGKLRRWEKYLDEYKLPDWEDIPDIGLYMEQVIALLKYYLDYLPPELKEEQFLTAAAINNYVRKKVMPEPVKKKYYRVHIAYLLIICSLKHSLSIPTLQTMIPVDLSAEELRGFYESYARRHRLAAKYFTAQVRDVAAGILGHEGSEVSTASTAELIETSAVVSGFSRLLAEKLLLLEGKSLEEVGNIEVERPKK